MMHFWETEFQKQINFLSLISELENISLNHHPVDKRTSVGVIRREVLQDIQITDRGTHQKKAINRRIPLWMFNIVPKSDVFAAHQPILYYINKHNYGCGIVLIDDPILGTKTLFRANSIPSDKWGKLINAITSIEPQCWHDPSTDPSRPAPFINNGNKAHQYVQRSALDLHSLCELARNVFK
jgi:hypothetical protein